MIKSHLLRSILLVGVSCLLGCNDGNTPTSPTVTTSFTWSSTFTSNGSATRSFTTGDRGAIAVTLTSVTPSVALSIGVGIPRGDGGGCSVVKAVETVAGPDPQLTEIAEPGAYCVKVADVGQVREAATFSVAVTYP